MGKRRFSVGQMIVLGVLVIGLVFGVTYLALKAGTAQPPRPVAPPSPNGPGLLVFSETQWPTDETNPANTEAAAIAETKAEGHHDFRFTNSTANTVELFLHEKTCKCTSVEAVLLPEAAKDTTPAAADAAKLDWHVIEPHAKGFPIPGHSAGAVRLRWNPERLGKDRLSAMLWTDAGAASGEPITLSVNLDLVAPLMVSAEDDVKVGPVDNDVYVGTLAAGDVRVVNLVAWSATRPKFDLKVEPPDHPCIQCGEPKPLDEPERAALGKKAKHKVLCGYRVPVTVREETADGKQLDLGLFRKFVKFTVTKGGIEPVAVALAGNVHGDITLGQPEDHEIIDLKSFRQDREKSQPFILSTPNPKLELEVAEVPEFLKVDLKTEASPGQLGKSWQMNVTVPPGALTGPVPPRTRIVLRTRGDRPRRILIPVTGIAYVP
jgi:hypothetical protein